MSSGPSPRLRLSEEKLARAALTYLAEPGDPALGALLAICSPAEVLAAIKAGMRPGTGPGCGDTPASRAALDRALGRWRARLPGLPDDERLADTSRDGIRLTVSPGDHKIRVRVTAGSEYDQSQEIEGDFNANLPKTLRVAVYLHELQVEWR